MAQSKARKIAASRIDEDYLQTQINGIRQQDTHRDHKQRINDFDALYRGEFDRLSVFAELTDVPAGPLVANIVKDAVHDIARLANEAKGSPVFTREGEGQTHLKKQAMRAGIAQTLWHMGNGPEMETELIMDMEYAGYAAVSAYYKKGMKYPVFLRLNPRMCYPEVVNGKLFAMTYIETMKERYAAQKWPDLGLNDHPLNTANVYVCMYVNGTESVQSVSRSDASGDAGRTDVVDRWEHGLDCVPVAFVKLPTADERFHGYFDQLGGPLLTRNKIVSLLVDYLQDMVHASFEEKGVLNWDEEPSSTTVYHHDPNAEFQTYIRRVAPAAPAGAVFGLLQYMDAQEAQEASQPPSRVGVVSQSIASGSFVASTQGTLSSVVKELQDCMATLRRDLNYIAFEIDARWCDVEKPLFQAVAGKHTYLPSKDMGDWMHHTIQYGAAAGLNRAEADNRIAMHLTQRLIDKGTARAQLDYIDDISSVQDRIDEENLQDAFFQRFAADPNTPQSIMAKVLVEMNKGRSFVDVLEEVQPELFAAEQAKLQAAAPPAGAPAAGGAEGIVPPSEGDTLGGGGSIQPALPTPPVGQVVSRNPVF